MKLYYRGLSYEYQPSQFESKKTTSVHNLTYRGLSYDVASNFKFDEVPQEKLAYKLSFRGIGYCVNKTA